LDQFHTLGMHGDPIDKTNDAVALQSHWQCDIKQTRTKLLPVTEQRKQLQNYTELSQHIHPV